MRNIYSEELEILLDDFDKIYDSMNYMELLVNNDAVLKRRFMLMYKQVYYQVKAANMQKPKNKREYNLLKLRRLFALWVNNNIIEIEGGIHYSANDQYNQFPLFAMQNPKIVPTYKTINKLRVKALVSYTKANNIQDLRQLRASLMALKIDNNQINNLTDLYRKMQARSEMNSYSEKG
ncbi:MAG: hypothetical protein J6Q51_00260 [Clostridia bacterium]|nr:hypothetical protein [Clostridia bacterium]